MYSLKELKQILKERDDNFIDEFGWHTLEKIIQGWEEDLKRKEHVTISNYNATYIR